MVSAWLSRYADVRIVEHGEPRRLTRLPDGRTIIVFRLFADERTGDLSVMGPRTRALFKHATGLARTVAIDLKPGWSMQFLGIPAHALTDRIVHLQELWGATGGELLGALLANPEPRNIVEQLATALATHASTGVDPAAARLARRAARLLDAGEVRIGGVARELGVTERHLRRAFVESIGVGPKDYARHVRLSRALTGASSGADWGRVAANAGYYDQAHLIGEFRDLIGLTPNAYARTLTP